MVRDLYLAVWADKGKRLMFLWFYWGEHKPCVGYVYIHNLAAFELFRFTQNVSDCNVVAFNLNVNHIFKLSFPIKDNVKFAHKASQLRKKLFCVIRAFQKNGSKAPKAKVFSPKS